MSEPEQPSRFNRDVAAVMAGPLRWYFILGGGLGVGIGSAFGSASGTILGGILGTAAGLAIALWRLRAWDARHPMPAAIAASPVPPTGARLKTPILHYLLVWVGSLLIVALCALLGGVLARGLYGRDVVVVGFVGGVLGGIALSVLLARRARARGYLATHPPAPLRPRAVPQPELVWEKSAKPRLLVLLLAPHVVSLYVLAVLILHGAGASWIENWFVDTEFIPRFMATILPRISRYTVELMVLGQHDLVLALRHVSSVGLAGAVLLNLLAAAYCAKPAWRAIGRAKAKHGPMPASRALRLILGGAVFIPLFLLFVWMPLPTVLTFLAQTEEGVGLNYVTIMAFLSAGPTLLGALAVMALMAVVMVAYRGVKLR